MVHHTAGDESSSRRVARSTDETARTSVVSRKAQMTDAGTMRTSVVKLLSEAVDG